METKRMIIDVGLATDDLGKTHLLIKKDIKGKWNLIEQLGVIKAIENKIARELEGTKNFEFKKGGKNGT